MTKAGDFLSLAFNTLFEYTVPPVVYEGRWRNFYGLTFFVSLLYLSAATSLTVTLSERLSAALGLPEVIEGVFVLSVGAQLPDTLASIAMVPSVHRRCRSVV